MLKAQGLSIDAVKRRISDEIRRNRVVGRKVRLRISVTEAEVTQYLEANRPKLETGLTYHARHILIQPDAGGRHRRGLGKRPHPGRSHPQSAGRGRGLRRARQAELAGRDGPGRRRSRNAQARRACPGHRAADSQPRARGGLAAPSLGARVSHLPARVEGQPRGRGARAGQGADSRDSLPREVRRALRRVDQGDQTARDHRRAAGRPAVKNR